MLKPFSFYSRSILLSVLQKVITIPIIEDKLLSAIIGGILAGVGLGIIFTREVARGQILSP